jgi:nucleoside transporter
MPTLALVNSVSFDQLDHPEKQFPAIRVLGTIGWIVAGLMVGLVLPKVFTSVNDVGATNIPFAMAGIVSLVLGVYSFTLPNSPPKSRGQKVSVGRLLGLDALALMKKPSFAIFVACSFLLCIPLAMYYGWANRYIAEAGMKATETVMTYGQMSEIVFMLLLPLFLMRFGVKTMLAVGMGAWAARYFLFGYGQTSPGFWMLYGAIILHGICYDFFFVTGQLYTDHVAPTALRASAQGLIALITYGAGMYVGNMVGACVEGKTTLAEKVGSLTVNWQQFWLVPTIMAAVILVVFMAAFHDKVRLGVTKKEGVA